MAKTIRIIALAAIAALLCASAFAAPPQAKPPQADKVTMNFKDADIETVVQFISKLTGKNFILDDAATGKKVTVISPTELNHEEAYEVFQAILSVKDLTIVPAGSIYKIMPSQKAKAASIETVGETSPPGDRFVTQLITLKNIGAARASDIINQLRSPNSSLVVYEPTNLLILTESYSNIERMMGIISAIDVEGGGSTMEIIKVRYASVDAVSKILTQAVTDKSGKGKRLTPAASAPKAPPSAQGGAPSGPASPSGVQSSGDDAPKIISDPRTNSLIVIADVESIAFIKELLAALDVETPSGQGNITVLHLKYAEAETLASVLTSISSKTTSASKTSIPKSGQPENLAATAQPTITSAKAAEVSAKFEEPVYVMPDKATNSLIIVASQQDFATLKRVIDQLDVRLPQVLVEALIMEMSYSRALELGVEWRSTANIASGNKMVAGGSNFGGISSLSSLASNPLSGPSGLFLAAIDGTVEVGGVTFPNVGALLRALQTKGDVNVISSPNILTVDNSEAKIAVTNKIPFQTSEKYDNNGNPIYTYEYRDVGLTLSFTPQINDEDYIKLKLSQETSNVISTTSGTNSNAPTTSNRTVSTTIMVKNNATVAIGGILQDNSQITTSSVPCLGDIPLLGALFRSNKNTKDKTNLMIFLTPRIIRENEDLEIQSRRKAQEYRNFASDKKSDDSDILGHTFDLFDDTLDPNLKKLDEATGEKPAESQEAK